MDHIRMDFPANTEYIGVIRLAVSGIASGLEFNVDEIEDLKSCASEACLLLLCGQKCSSISVKIEVGKAVKVEVSGQNVKASDCEEDCSNFSEEISKLMIQALSEDARFEEENGLLNAVAFEKKHAM